MTWQGVRVSVYNREQRMFDYYRVPKIPTPLPLRPQLFVTLEERLPALPQNAVYEGSGTRPIGVMARKAIVSRKQLPTPQDSGFGTMLGGGALFLVLRGILG